MKWKDKQYHCRICGKPREPGNTLCHVCYLIERRERYGLDPAYRHAAKEAYSRWRAENLQARADYMREWRKRQKEKNPRD